MGADLIHNNYFGTDEAATDPLLSIQATHFPSGGLTIAISVSHRVFDIASLATFIVAWSNAVNPDKTIGLLTPSFHIPSLLPIKDHDFDVNSKKSSSKDDAPKMFVKRFVFNKEALTSLRSKLSPNKAVSRVRIVCAAIDKTLVRLDRAKHRKDRGFVVFQPVNMRERTVPPLPQHACGNFSFSSITRRIPASEVKDIGIEELVDLMGEAVRKSIADRAGIISPDRDGCDIIIDIFGELVKELQTGETNVIFFTDRSKFGFYEADFGWGKPVWTSIRPQRPRSNSTMLMSNKEGDGIEAWVHLTQNDMDYLEQDEDINLFTT